MRRIEFLGIKYLGNSTKKEVHDLDMEDFSAIGCQIDEIISAGHAVTFNPDTLEEAHRCGYDNCAKCLWLSEVAQPDP
jgi:hypothetical protein